MGIDQMITDEELEAIVDNYCMKIKKVCEATTWASPDEVLDKAAEINKLVARAQEIKSMCEAQKTAGEKKWAGGQ